MFTPLLLRAPCSPWIRVHMAPGADRPQSLVGWGWGRGGEWGGPGRLNVHQWDIRDLTAA